MKLINVNDIVILESRQRDKIDENHVNDLMQKILEVGLIQPIVLRDDCETLVAGECRTTAVTKIASLGLGIKHEGKTLPAGSIPFVTTGEASEIMIEQIELYENTSRLNLTWQQEDRAVLKIKSMIEALNPDKEIGSRDVAKEIKKGEEPSSYDVRKVDEVELRDKFADDPLVQKAKSRREANKIIEKKLDEQNRERLAAQFKEVETEHEIMFGDSTKLIKEIDDNVIDIILADPIYGIDADSMHMFQRVKYKEDGHHEYDDSLATWDAMFDIMPSELYRVAKAQAHCYLFCDISRFFDFFITKPGNKKPSRVKGLATRMAEAGWDVWARPLVWYKGNIGSLPKPEHGPRYTTEYILFAIKGEKKISRAGQHDCITVPQTTGHEHGAGKPPALYSELLSRSSNPGDTVLDFCAGSFPILMAANSNDCKAVAMEINDKWQNMADLRKTKKVEDE